MKLRNGSVSFRVLDSIPADLLIEQNTSYSVGVIPGARGRSLVDTTIHVHNVQATGEHETDESRCRNCQPLQKLTSGKAPASLHIAKQGLWTNSSSPFAVHLLQRIHSINSQTTTKGCDPPTN